MRAGINQSLAFLLGQITVTFWRNACSQPWRLLLRDMFLNLCGAQLYWTLHISNLHYLVFVIKNIYFHKLQSCEIIHTPDGGCWFFQDFWTGTSLFKQCLQIKWIYLNRYAKMCLLNNLFNKNKTKCEKIGTHLSSKAGI